MMLKEERVHYLFALALIDFLHLDLEDFILLTSLILLSRNQYYNQYEAALSMDDVIQNGNRQKLLVFLMQNK